MHVFADGSPVDFARWGTGEPSNSFHGVAGSSGEDGVTITWVASPHSNGWWNDAHDTGYTAATGCTTCSATQNAQAAGNYPLCQTDFPADTDINRHAQRMWKLETTADRFVAIGRMMPQTDAKAYCESRDTDGVPVRKLMSFVFKTRNFVFKLMIFAVVARQHPLIDGSASRSARMQPAAACRRPAWHSACMDE